MPLYGQSGYGSGRYGIADQGPIAPLSIYYYLNLLTSEYKASPNLNANLTSVLQLFADVQACNATMTEKFDLDFAQGPQLDTLGVIAGVSRTVAFQPSGGVSPILDDDTYRLLIKATIANNQWDGERGSLYAIWRTLFPSGRIVVIDNQNMSATVVISGGLSSIIQDLISNGYIVPQSEAVQYTFLFSTLPVFGFGPANAFIAGFNDGVWAG